MKNLRSKFKEIFFAIIIWVLFFVLLDFLSGLVIKNRYIAVDPVSERSAKNSWGYFEPNQEKIILFPGKEEYKVTINSLGLRSVGLSENFDWSSVGDKYRILALGDSVTFGTFVNDEGSYPYQLQQILNKNNKDAVVFNAGVGWSTITDVLYYLKIKGLALKPHLAIISFCDNDLNGLDEEPVYERIKQKSNLSIFDKVKKTKFMRFFRKLELYVRYARSTKKIKDERVKMTLFKKTKDLDDILFVASYEAGKVTKDPYSKDLKKSWDKYFAVLDEVINRLRAENVDIIFYIHPSILTVFDVPEDYYQDILVKYLKGKPVDYVDLRHAFKERKGQYLELYNDLPRDFHLSGLGNQVLTYKLYDKIKDKIK